MKLFEYCVIYTPKDKYNNDGKNIQTSLAKILVEPVTVLATDASKASMIAARAIPEDYLDKLDDVEVAVRPF